ncbi:MAG: site-specific DNA-methyltransferase [Planctomycetes bacterium]|nr:site-specific DNA-methyltransferase [Planctomycetota bacterium]
MSKKTNGKERVGPAKGDFITPPDVQETDERADALPAQEEFWRPPTRFGSVPVEKEPLGWDRRKGFRKLFPAVYLPFQVVERVQFGHPDLEPNRLFWGDNLHVMRQLPSESIDLIYIDPPFFSGRQYNVIFGDQNELRSFSDIWEGGMPGYLIWLNARLYEMKRLIKKTGSIYVHLDWHAAHYVKVEMDKVFGHDGFKNEIVWDKRGIGRKSRIGHFPRDSESLLWYAKSTEYSFEQQYFLEPMPKLPGKKGEHKLPQGFSRDEEGRVYWTSPRGDYTDESVEALRAEGRIYETKNGNVRIKYFAEEDETHVFVRRTVTNVWRDVPDTLRQGRRIGYPTEKPELLIERIIAAHTYKDAVVADFFCGGGTTPVVAQRMGRQWIACDQSRVAVAITADRISRLVEERIGSVFPVPDFTVEHWGVYETRRLAEAPPEQFRGFILRAFGAVVEEREEGIHGYKGAIPVWVGGPDQKKAATATEVQAFANAIRKTLRYKQDNLRDGIMLAWAFRPDAMEAAERLRRLEQTDLNFIRLDTIRIDSPRFREHVTALTTQHADYENFLTFVQPPKVEVGYKRIGSRTYKFDVSETVVLNAGAKIINVQWDFDYDKRFSSTPGYSFARGGKKEVALQAQYEFPTEGRQCIACKVQDDMGGEGLWTDEIEVS